MNGDVANLVLEQLRAIRDMANIHQRLGRQDDRLDRIGRRLEFTDTPA